MLRSLTNPIKLEDLPKSSGSRKRKKPDISSQSSNDSLDHLDSNRFFSHTYTLPREIDPIPHEIQNYIIHFSQKVALHGETTLNRKDFAAQVYRFLAPLIKKAKGGITEGYIISMIIYLERYMEKRTKKLTLQDIPLMVATLFLLAKTMLDDALSTDRVEIGTFFTCKELAEAGNVELKQLLKNRFLMCDVLDYKLHIPADDYSSYKQLFDKEAKPDFDLTLPKENILQGLEELINDVRPTIDFSLLENSLLDDAESDTPKQKR